MEQYDQTILTIKKRLYQLFLHYCHENKSVGLTFEAFSKSSQLIDLRLFLRYFKDLRYVEANKYRFKVTSATLLFRNVATNGLSLSFQQFWLIHRKMFGLEDLGITRRDIIEAEYQQLAEMKSKWED
jgi:hypothetical protein